MCSTWKYFSISDTNLIQVFFISNTVYMHPTVNASYKATLVRMCCHNYEYKYLLKRFPCHTLATTFNVMHRSCINSTLEFSCNRYDTCHIIVCFSWDVRSFILDIVRPLLASFENCNLKYILDFWWWDEIQTHHFIPSSWITYVFYTVCCYRFWDMFFTLPWVFMLQLGRHCRLSAYVG